MVHWQQVFEGKATASDLRKNYVDVHGIIIQALGIAGRSLLDENPDYWKERLGELEKIDWSRSNKLWEGRVINSSRITASNKNVTLASILIKKALGLSLGKVEQDLKKIIKRKTESNNMDVVTEPQSEVSVFDRQSLNDIHKEIQDVYLSDHRPWVIGYSGGKDSTTCLQLIFYAISELPVEKRNKPIHVIATDTLVETPLMVDIIDNTLKQIRNKATECNIPFITHRLKPQIVDSFWVSLLGKGYPAPSQRFRWCTHRLKIRPANKFITEQLSKHGEVILVLGVRRQESATRAQVISLHSIQNSVLSRHSTFSGAFVYTPIKEWSINDVWSYLLQVPFPMG